MMATAASSSLGSSGSKRRLRMFAIAAALLLAGAVYGFQAMPVAIELPNDARLEASSGEALALYNLRASQLLRYDGGPGSGLALAVSTGRLAPSTRAALRGLGHDVPNVKGGSIRWQAKPPPAGRVSVRIRNGRQSPAAGILLEPAGSHDEPALNVRAVETVLSVEVRGAPEDSGEAGPTDLEFAGAELGHPALASMAIQFEVPPGETLTFAFDSGEALSNATFRAGEFLDVAGKATALHVGRVGVGRAASRPGSSQAESVDRGACAARPGKVLVTRARLTPADCALGTAPGEDRLFASGVTVAPGRVGANIEGSGFIVTNGRVDRPGLWAAVTTNPLNASLAGALVIATAWPLWRLWKRGDL